MRAPYLHNGSVPTLDDLLKAPDKRPTKFYTGNDVYDPRRMSASSSDEPAEGEPHLRRVRHHSQAATATAATSTASRLSDADRAALLEYLKTL